MYAEERIKYSSLYFLCSGHIIKVKKSIRGETYMIIGIPKEIMHDERRVSATPDVCGRYISLGHTVLVEHDAGEGAYFHDEQYAAAGAQVVPGAGDVYERADLILKVKEPLLNEQTGLHEVDMMRP
ncbi:MAG TPA: hypothetical protein PKZ39_06200, partial [Clostridia bacterium]|nr:hypothetical protein [Clostridia bacterium]